MGVIRGFGILRSTVIEGVHPIGQYPRRVHSIAGMVSLQIHLVAAG